MLLLLFDILAERRIESTVRLENGEGVWAMGVGPAANVCRSRVQDHPTLRGIPVLVRINIHITIVVVLSDTHVVVVVVVLSSSTITRVLGWFRRGVARRGSEFGECSSATLIVGSVGVIAMKEHGTLVTSRRIVVVVVVGDIRLLSLTNWSRNYLHKQKVEFGKGEAFILVLFGGGNSFCIIIVVLSFFTILGTTALDGDIIHQFEHLLHRAWS